jgi:excisionase family DNA binding protein
VLLLVEGLEEGGAVVSKLGDLLTPQEAAEMMGVSRQYVDKLIQAGRIHAEFKPASSHRVIKASDVIAFTRKREEGSARVGSTINELIDAGFEY